MPSVCLASICRCSVDELRSMLENAASYVGEAVVVVAPASPLLALRKQDLPIPVTFVEHEWNGYGPARNVALREAEKRAEWVLTLDHDDRLEGALPDLVDAARRGVDAFDVRVELPGATFYRPHLTRSGRGWEFRGVVHEALYSSENNIVSERCDCLKYISGPSNGTPELFREHARLLEAELQRNPNDARTAFYLAQSYRDGQLLGQAFEAYLRRAQMSNGFWEEVFCSLLEAAKLAWRMGAPESVVRSAFESAVEFDPERAEPHFYLASYLVTKEKYAEAGEAFLKAKRLPWPKNRRLFVDPAAYAAKA